MLSSSVGNKGVNKSGDVKTVQQIINFRNDLRKALPKLVVDGKFGAKTQAGIDLIQSNFLKKPDGRIDPYGTTIKRMWPIAYGKPTGLAVRGTDSYGAGHHGASRGKRVHDGTDYNSTPGQQVKAPLSGRVTKISKPYSSGIDAMLLSGLEIEACDGTKCWVWYMQPSANIVGAVVKAGSSIIGMAKTLKNRYKNGITDHVHVRIHTRFGKKVNPSIVIK
ncbi:MAG: peptidoglycan DD-metalloendopeptidase family protein [Gammaproteobacteria bacterium]|nr:peptidoglycan DD-metalloendopeptidase family protein [Gammaproteobacteria bacterium]